MEDGITDELTDEAVQSLEPLVASLGGVLSVGGVAFGPGLKLHNRFEALGVSEEQSNGCVKTQSVETGIKDELTDEAVQSLELVVVSFGGVLSIGGVACGPGLKLHNRFEAWGVGAAQNNDRAKAQVQDNAPCLHMPPCLGQSRGRSGRRVGRVHRRREGDDPEDLRKTREEELAYFDKIGLFEEVPAQRCWVATHTDPISTKRVGVMKDPCRAAVREEQTCGE